MSQIQQSVAEYCPVVPVKAKEEQLAEEDEAQQPSAHATTQLLFLCHPFHSQLLFPPVLLPPAELKCKVRRSGPHLFLLVISVLLRCNATLWSMLSGVGTALCICIHPMD
ncbi:hypothetical protein CHARACLAT_027399 [Characodon lateralis]|uniref:Uncharacterized protein n=1 Tax=Characodon lateralis TaxID=208331 RepID=A0ABU7DAK5_9TELE|nr:hypothetical protein [Characodon lateralis]